jgi:hypothetical protein
MHICTKFSIMVSGCYYPYTKFVFYSCTSFIWNGRKRVPHRENHTMNRLVSNNNLYIVFAH